MTVVSPSQPIRSLRGFLQPQETNYDCSIATLCTIINTINDTKITQAELITSIDSPELLNRVVTKTPGHMVGVTFSEFSKLVELVFKKYVTAKYCITTVPYGPELPMKLLECSRDTGTSNNIIAIYFLQSIATGTDCGTLPHISPLGSTTDSSLTVLDVDHKTFATPYTASINDVIAAMKFDHPTYGQGGFISMTKIPEITSIEVATSFLGDDLPSDVSSNELMQYPLFFREYVFRRVPDLTKIDTISKIPELPNGSLLHINDNMLMDKPIVHIPDADNVWMAKPPEQKYMSHVIRYDSHPTDVVTVDSSGILLQIGNLSSELMKYRQANTRWLKLTNTPAELPSRNNVQSVVNYNPLYRARIASMWTNGEYKTHRLFKYVMGTIINTAAQMPERHHFIQIPAKHLILKRDHFLRSFKDHHRGSVRFQTEPYYLFVMHLLDYIKNDCTTSMFHTIPTDLAKKLHFMITFGDHCIIYNLAMLKELNSHGDAILLRTMAHLNMLVSQSDQPDLETVTDKDSEPVDEISVDDTVSQVTEAPNKLVSVSPTVPINTPKYSNTAPAFDTTKDLVKDINTSATSLIEHQDRMTPSQKQKALHAHQQYTTITLGNQTIGELLLPNEMGPRAMPKMVPVAAIPASQKPLNENHLEFLQGKVDDASLLKSRISTFDTSYMTDLFHKDLASVLVSFNAHGMFLKGVKEELQVDKLNRMRQYSVQYEDLNHNSHTIRFTLPDVDHRGYIYVNGTTKVLKKQRVAVPIAKVSPTRVAMNTNFNKALVERTTSVAHSFDLWFMKALRQPVLKDDVTLVHGHFGTPNNRVLSWEYTSLGKRLAGFTITSGSEESGTELPIKDLALTFDYQNRFATVKEPYKKSAETHETLYGVFCGTNKAQTHAVYMHPSGITYLVDMAKGAAVLSTTLVDLIADLNRKFNPSRLTEWVDLKILDKKMPVAVALCYRYGFKNLLDYLKVVPTKVPKGSRLHTKLSDVVLRFSDYSLVIPRTPAATALLLNGLNNLDLSNTLLEDMDTRDAYYDFIQQLGLSINTIKGIDSFFDMFIDPISRDVLYQMGEPTNVRDLLIRATTLLTTQDCMESSSSANFRYRSYERMVGEVYNAMARAHETWKYKSIGATNKFSINEFLVKKNILQDQLTENVDILNPIGALRTSTSFSHVGNGGRSADTFTIDDRRYPEDGIGVISEATVDNAKVALNAQLSMNPRLTNLRGLSHVADPSQLDPSELLSITSLLMPCCTNDDGKRANFVSIQLPHYVPTRESDVGLVRTGYEQVVAHRVTLPFSYAAQDNGTILKMDDTTKTMVIAYRNGTKHAVHYGEDYTNNGGGGFYITQKIAVNKGFKEGSSVKKGDVILYNSEFFTPDPYYHSR